MKKFFVGVLVSVLLLVGVIGLAAGQDGGLAGLLQPLVVDVEQAVPVEVLLAVPVGEGEVMTVTAPITVHVGLRVSIDGPQVVTVEPLPAEEASITVEAVEPESDAPAEMVDSRGLAYEIIGGDSIEVLQVQSRDGMIGLEIVAEVENVGDEPVQFATLVASLYDADGNLLEVMPGMSAVTMIEPGKTAPVSITTLTDTNLVARYEIHVED